MRLLFEGGYYSGCGYYSSKYGNCGNKEVPLEILSRILAQSCLTLCLNNYVGRHDCTSILEGIAKGISLFPQFLHGALQYSPMQLLPSDASRYPALQLHVKLPALLLHNCSQSSLSSAHSLISDEISITECQ